MQGKDILGVSSKEDDWKRSGRETGKAGCCPFPVLERILVRPRLTLKDHKGAEESRGWALFGIQGKMAGELHRRLAKRT